MSNIAKLEQHKLDTREIITALIEDGSDPDALYEIEHHFSGERFDDIEAAMEAAYKLGYEVYESEEMELEDGSPIICFDVVSEIGLNAEIIDEQSEQLMKLADDFNISYDGWGTYFESDEDDEEGEELDDEQE